MGIKQVIGRKIGDVGRFFQRNGPTILSITAVVGLGATAYFSAKGAVKQHEEMKDGAWENKTPVQKVTILTTNFGPAIAAGIGTAACIVGANALSKEQQAKLMATCIAGEQAFKQYRKKTDEVFGEGADKKVREAMATEMLKCQPADRVIQVPKGCSDEEMLFYLDHPVYEDGQGLWFRSTLQYVKDCNAAINRNFALRGDASLEELITLYLHGDSDYGGCSGDGWCWSQGADWGMAYIDFYIELVESNDPDTPPYYRIGMDWPPNADYLNY